MAEALVTIIDTFMILCSPIILLELGSYVSVTGVPLSATTQDPRIKAGVVWCDGIAGSVDH